MYRGLCIVINQIYWINNNIPDSAHFWSSRLKSAWTLPPCDWWYSLMLITLNLCVVDFFSFILLH